MNVLSRHTTTAVTINECEPRLLDDIRQVRPVPCFCKATRSTAWMGGQVGGRAGGSGGGKRRRGREERGRRAAPAG